MPVTAGQESGGTEDDPPVSSEERLAGGTSSQADPPTLRDARVEYKGVALPSGYRVDLLVADAVVVDVKAVDKIHPLHRPQLLTYLRLSGTGVGLLLNSNLELLVRDGMTRVVVDLAPIRVTSVIPRDLKCSPFRDRTNTERTEGATELTEEEGVGGGAGDTAG